MMIFSWLLFILIIVAVIVWLKNSGQLGKWQVTEGSSAIKILEERYARGEIDKEEFEARKRDLMQ